MDFLEDRLRKAGVGVWKAMPYPEPWERRDHHGGFIRFDLWRISTRHEIISHFKDVMKRVYKFYFMMLVAGFCALYALVQFALTNQVIYGAFAILLAVVTAYLNTKAVGAYTGGWSDYENEPVRMLTSNSYVVNGGYGMMAGWPKGTWEPGFMEDYEQATSK